MRCGELDSASCEISSEVSPLICGPVVARGPGDQDLRLGEQERAQPVGLHLQVGDVGAQVEFRLAGANARAHQQDRRHHGKAEQRQRRRQRRKFLVIEVEQRRNGLRDGQVGG